MASAGIKPYEFLLFVLVLAAMHVSVMRRARCRVAQLPEDEGAIVNDALRRHCIFLPAVFGLAVAFWCFFKLTSWWVFHLPPTAWSAGPRMWLWAYLVLVPSLLVGQWWAGWDVLLSTAHPRGTPEQRRALTFRWHDKRRWVKIAVFWVVIALLQVAIVWFGLSAKFPAR